MGSGAGRRWATWSSGGQRSGADRTLHVGESLGAAVVTRLATERPGTRSSRCACCVRERYPLVDQIARVPVPTTVVYGARDSLVPPDRSRRVAAAVPRPDRGGRGADHRDGEPLEAAPLIQATLDLARRSG